MFNAVHDNFLISFGCGDPTTYGTPFCWRKMGAPPPVSPPCRMKLKNSRVQQFKASAPGSLMLLGEYAVLAGKKAIVAAVDQFVDVTITPRQDEQIYLHSALGQYTTDLKNIVIVSPFEYVLTALTLEKKLMTGCDVWISGNCESGIGLGSSAAVTIATLAAKALWQEHQLPAAENLWHLGKQVIDRVQGKGSGADLAASIYGGVIAFQNNPLRVERIAPHLPLCAIYSGSKLKTARAIDIVSQRRQQLPAFFEAMDEVINQLSVAAIPAIKNQDWQTLGLLFNLAQTLMVTLGVSNELLNTLLTQMHSLSVIYGAKISGSGLGDCIIGLGHLPADRFPINPEYTAYGVKQIHLNVTGMGVRAHAQ